MKKIKKKSLDQYTKKEKVKFFDEFYKKAEKYFAGYEEKTLDYDDEKWEMKDELMNELASVLYPSASERDVYRLLDKIDFDEEKVGSLKFAWYSHHWDKEINKKRLKELKEIVGGVKLLTELEPSGEINHYCVHSCPMEEKLLEEIKRAFDTVSPDDPWLNQRFDGTCLTLEGEKEVNILFTKANDVLEEEKVLQTIPVLQQEDFMEMGGSDLLPFAETNASLRPIEELFGVQNATLYVEPQKPLEETTYDAYVVEENFENKLGHVWQIINEKNEIYDFVFDGFVQRESSTSYLPTFEMAQGMITMKNLENTRLIQKAVPVSS